MRLLKITTSYHSYLKDFYGKHPELAEKSYLEQKAAMDFDAFGWADFWSHALTPLGYDVMEVAWNVEPMQWAWAMENSLRYPAKIDLDEIVVEQARQFKPDILWFDDPNEALLKRLKSEVPSICLVLGWTGSVIPQTNAWHQMNLILSCAQESVDFLRGKGFHAEQLHHGFDPRVNSRLKNNPKQIDISFIGQVIRARNFHFVREAIMEKLCAEMDIRIFSPSADLTFIDDLKAILGKGLYSFMQSLMSLGIPQEFLGKIPIIGRSAYWAEAPMLPVNRSLKPFIYPPVFGLEMFQVIHDSKITLNIHADSSPVFASNMRLFEVTGVGTCLVTDWKENLPELFEPDKEVVVYKTADECVEKVKWLLDRPEDREKIAKAGQARTLTSHTFLERAHRLDEIIRKGMN
jgi:hypothetical protein